MKVIDVEQLSPEWFAARSGVPTSSEFHKIITTKGLPSKSREAYLYRLAGERIIGKPEETYQNSSMQRGIELEPEAINYYQILRGEIVERVGFCLADESFKAGASPDGLVSKNGIIQIKCPSLAVHVGYLLKNELPSEYFQQVHGELFVTGREWSDFMSYYPGMKPLILRVDRDDVFIKSLRIELEIFCEELERTIKKLGDS